MYTIYADGNLVYTPDLVSDNLFITSPTYTKEVNKAGSCQFYIYPDNPYYDHMNVLKTQILVKENNEIVWRGRVLKTERDFDKRKTVYCEGTFSYFVDSTLRPYKHTKTMPDQLRYIVEKHNEMVEDFKKFVVKDITVDDLYGSKEWEETQYNETKSALDELLNDYGGYFVVGFENDQNTLSYLKDPSKVSNQTIEFGENLLKLTDVINPDSVFTVLIPVGYDSNGNQIDIKPINNNKDYIESTDGINQFGKVTRIHTFDKDYSSASDLLTDATKFLNDNIKASRSIDINALDLHMIDPTVNRIDIYDMIRIYSKPHNLDEYEMCTKVTIDMENPDNSDYTIGRPPQGIEDALAGKLTIGSSSSGSGGGGGSALPDGDNIQY
jgi:phage minor structural protein